MDSCRGSTVNRGWPGERAVKLLLRPDDVIHDDVVAFALPA
ncbi:MAG: hypothetical protein P8171_17680 [Candidatus Thiodiazotropha sp.]